MTPNAQEITALAQHCWSANLPVSFVLAKCIELKLYRPFIRRFVEAVYEREDTEFDTWTFDMDAQTCPHIPGFEPADDGAGGGHCYDCGIPKEAS